MINGAHSNSVTSGSFNIDNCDSGQNVTFKIRVRNWFFGSKNQDYFQTFFQNNYSFFFETQGYQNRWSIMTLKKAGTNAFFMIQTFTSSLFTTLFPGLENRRANFKRLFQELKTLCEPWKWICIFSNFSAFIPFWRDVEYLWISIKLISWNSTQKEKFVAAYFISSITHEIRHFHATVMQWLIKTVYLSKPIAFFTFSMPWSSSLLKLPNYRKISVPFLSQGISQACISGRFVLQRWPI